TRLECLAPLIRKLDRLHHANELAVRGTHRFHGHEGRDGRGDAVLQGDIEHLGAQRLAALRCDYALVFEPADALTCPKCTDRKIDLREHGIDTDLFRPRIPEELNGRRAALDDE